VSVKCSLRRSVDPDRCDHCFHNNLLSRAFCSLSSSDSSTWALDHSMSYESYALSSSDRVVLGPDLRALGRTIGFLSGRRYGWPAFSRLVIGSLCWSRLGANSCVIVLVVLVGLGWPLLFFFVVFFALPRLDLWISSMLYIDLAVLTFLS
jgi:hypothetical protein